MADLKLLGICGSLRAASTNRLLMREAAQRFGKADFIEGNLRFPLYDGDEEEASGIPPVVQMLSDQIAEADAVVVVTPEYNKGVSGVLKNALDWVSRTQGRPWEDTPVALMSASAGRTGGERAQSMLQLCMMPFRPRLVIGPEVLLASASHHWDADGTLTDEKYGQTLDTLMQRLRAAAENYHSSRSG